MANIVIDRMDAEQFMEQLREVQENLDRPEWDYPSKVVQELMEAFTDLCRGEV